MKSFSERERACEASFRSGGPYWHCSTPGKDTPILFTSEDDYVLVMNVVAQAAFMFPRVKVIAFEVMDNHFHFVLAGEKTDCKSFFDFIVHRLVRYFPQIKGLPLRMDQIDDLQSMRTRIVYDHRNGYVANTDQTPFSYQWGSGRYYYNDFPIEREFSSITVTTARLMFRGRAPQLPKDWKVIDGYIAPSSYCALAFGMAMFRDAHHYFSMLYKEVEAFHEIADELSDEEFLTDPEAFNKLFAFAKDQMHVASFQELTKAQRVELARKMRYDFRSTNGQIRRVLGLSQYEVDALFPLRR